MNALQRASLPDQVAELLRQGIASARWSQEMPSEAELCREFHVSRVTLRKAIDQLVREHWLTPGGRGCHHRICKQVKTPRATRGQIVRVLTPYPLYAHGSVIHGQLDCLVERLGSAGFRVEFETRPALFTRHSPDELKRLDALPGTAAWLLLYATEPMQRWFAANKVPCLLAGRPHSGVELPSVFTDSQAIGRHAAGVFHQRGHRELVYLIAEFTSLNDRLCSEAFAEEAQQLGANVRIVSHRREPASLRRELEAILATRPRPTGFFCGCPEHCLTILGHLVNAGLRVPTDAAIIAGMDDEFLRYAVPEFACYRFDGTKLGRKAAAVLLDLIRHGPGKLRTIPIIPEFVTGGTLDFI